MERTLTQSRPSSNRLGSNRFQSRGATSSPSPRPHHHSPSSSAQALPPYRLLAAALFLTLTLLPPRLHATPRLRPQRQTVTDAPCGVQGPETISFNKSDGPKKFQLIKTGDCEIDFIDVYQIVSYEPRDYNIFESRYLEDGVSVEVTINLSWPKPSAMASDRHQYLVYKGYESKEDKEEGEAPIIQKFVKISIVEEQNSANVENYRDPLSSYLVIPPSPIYFLDEESAMANATCIDTNAFDFRVKAMAKIQGVNPRLSMEVVVYQEHDGKWEQERVWSDGGDTGDDWSLVREQVGTGVTTAFSNQDSEMTIDVVNPLQDSYFVFNMLVEDELNWYRTGSSHYIARRVREKCNVNQPSEIDKEWMEIERNTPATTTTTQTTTTTTTTTTTKATTILPNVIVDITESGDSGGGGAEGDSNAVEGNGIEKDQKLDSGNAACRRSTPAWQAVVTTLCALSLFASRR